MKFENILVFNIIIASTFLCAMDNSNNFFNYDWVKNKEVISIVKDKITKEYNEGKELIINNKDDNNFFGYNFYPIRDIQLPFLQHVHDRSSRNDIIVTELAAGTGSMTWKTLFALENKGRIYVNELSENMITKAKEKIANLNEKENNIYWIQGNCFDIIPLCQKNHNEDIEGKVDVLYVGNLEHFLTPKEDQDLLQLIYKLLAPNGRAFFLACAPVRETERSGFWITDDEYGIYDCYDTLGNDKLSHVNKFTPEIYRKAIDNLKLPIKIIDTYYLDLHGQRKDKWEPEKVFFCAAIIEKIE